MEKRCLVTGATGFVGSNLCKKLIEQDWNITIICRKSSKLDNLEEIKNKINIFEYDNDLKNMVKFFK